VATQKSDRAEALASIESVFSRFASRSSLPRLHQRVRAAVGEGVDAAAFPVLARIAARGRVRTSDLAESIGLDASTVSRKIADLAEAGLVRREPDPEDGRAHLLEVTERGRAVVARMRKVRSELLEEALHAWPTIEIRELAAMLDRFTAALADLG
jgi:DNA-binding MarR family transcriptional regulator